MDDEYEDPDEDILQPRQHFDFRQFQGINNSGQDSVLESCDEFNSDDEEFKEGFTKVEGEMQTLVKESKLVEELYYEAIFEKLQETRDGIGFGPPNPPYWSSHKRAPHPSVTSKYLTTIEDIAQIREEGVPVSMVREDSEEDENGPTFPELSTDITLKLSQSKSEWKTLKFSVAQSFHELHMEFDQYTNVLEKLKEEQRDELYNAGRDGSQNGDGNDEDSESDYEL